MTAQKELKVIVNYPAAKRPYKQDPASPSETLAVLKAAVLNAISRTWSVSGVRWRRSAFLRATRSSVRRGPTLSWMARSEILHARSAGILGLMTLHV